MNQKKRKKMTTKSRWNGLLVGAFKRPKKWQIQKPLTFQTNLCDEEIDFIQSCGVKVRLTSTGKITVPVGYVTDMASVPRACWAFIAPFDVARPAVVHDVLYEKINAVRGEVSSSDFKRLRAIADHVFFDAMGQTDPVVASWKKYSAYYAVRMFGWSAIKTSAKREW
jgi:hypothetical protein